MSTHNYLTINISKVYAIELKNEYEYDNFKENFIYEVAKMFNKSYEDCTPYAGHNFSFANRNFPSTNIASVSFDSIYNVHIYIHFYLTAGYYEGACLDYDIEFGSENTKNNFTISNYIYLDELLEDIIEYRMIKDIDAKSKLQFILYNMIRVAEEVCQKLSDRSLICSRTFSNGECLYETI